MHRYPSLAIAVVLLTVCPSRAVEVKPETSAAFNRYTQLSEQRMQNDLQSRPFLWVDGLPIQQRQAVSERLKQGEIVTQRLETLEHGEPVRVPGGLIHHWLAVVFIPGVNIKQTLALLQSYDEHSRIYSPHVLRSKLIQRNGDDFKVFLRLRETKIVTVVLDTEYDVNYVHVDSTRAYSRSYSTRVTEVVGPAESSGHEKPLGDDSGFLWRLNSYWHFCERDGGVYVQLEAISLTRDIPDGLGWLIRPFVSSIPRESLVFTLKRTREALPAVFSDLIHKQNP